MDFFSELMPEEDSSLPISAHPSEGSSLPSTDKEMEGGRGGTPTLASDVSNWFDNLEEDDFNILAC